MLRVRGISVDLGIESSKRKVLDYMVKGSEAYKGHLIYNASTNNAGYGIVYINGKAYFAHRLACWIYLNLDLDNLSKKALHERCCDRKNCWNLKHLYIGSQKDNVQDAIASKKFRGACYKNSGKTHCPQGHEYSPENMLISGGRRCCRICKREQSRRWKALHVRGM